MAWTAPRTFVTGEIVTAAHLNVHLRDNLIDLDRRTSPSNAAVGGPGTRASAAYGDMDIGAGPAVTVTIGAVGKALIAMSAALSHDTAGQAAFMGYQVSGASTVAANDDTAIAFTAPAAAQGIRMGMALIHSGLNAGSTTFAAKEKAAGGTGSYSSLRLSVTPLGS